jgi:hypothetical protein
MGYTIPFPLEPGLCAVHLPLVGGSVVDGLDVLLVVGVDVFDVSSGFFSFCYLS